MTEAPLDGVVVVDKPTGVGSTDVVRVVRRSAGQRRVGHTGTLDPLATGVLVVCLGRATRLVRFLQAGRKTYVADVAFGVETDTGDVTGTTVVTADASNVTRAAVDVIAREFVGELDQVPPMVSAIKIDGERLYTKARRGEEVERPPRRITVWSLQVLEVVEGAHATARLEIECSAGTYVRTLVSDIGRALGCGATMTALRRTRNGRFTEADAHPLEHLREAAADDRFAELLVSPRDALSDLPQRDLSGDDESAARAGRPLSPAGVGGPIALVAGADLIAVYVDRGGAARAEVVMVGADAATVRSASGDG